MRKKKNADVVVPSPVRELRPVYCMHSDKSFVYDKTIYPDNVTPNECCVTDAEIMSGKIVPSFTGQYDKDIKDGLNPLYKRGVDFTDVGNILSSIDATEESVRSKISVRRSELQKQDSPEKPE